jgi:uncharacterized protein with NRDE domain
MCLILFAYDPAPGARYRLVVAANRDERYARPASPVAPWPDAPEIVAGRDLEQGGTWMGLSRRGRFAAVTNYREGHAGKPAPRSRGVLVADFLRGGGTAADYAREVLRQGSEFNGFSLLVDDGDEFWFVSNRAPQPRRVEPGVHGLSNHLLDTPWPKVTAGTAALNEAIAAPAPTQIVDALYATLGARTFASDGALPDTGVGLAHERLLSPPFIVSEVYGTRSSSVVLLPAAGEAEFHERLYGAGGTSLGGSTLRVAVGAATTAAS